MSTPTEKPKTPPQMEMSGSPAEQQTPSGLPSRNLAELSDSDFYAWLEAQDPEDLCNILW
jgi:hypothetical protein